MCVTAQDKEDLRQLAFAEEGRQNSACVGGKQLELYYDVMILTKIIFHVQSLI